jgi:hypothetical protein
MQLTLQDIQELISAGKASDKLEETVLKYFKPRDYINRLTAVLQKRGFRASMTVKC